MATTWSDNTLSKTLNQVRVDAYPGDHTGATLNAGDWLVRGELLLTASIEGLFLVGDEACTITDATVYVNGTEVGSVTGVASASIKVPVYGTFTAADDAPVITADVSGDILNSHEGLPFEERTATVRVTWDPDEYYISGRTHLTEVALGGGLDVVVADLFGQQYKGTVDILYSDGDFTDVDVSVNAAWDNPDHKTVYVDFGDGDGEQTLFDSPGGNGGSATWPFAVDPTNQWTIRSTPLSGTCDITITTNPTTRPAETVTLTSPSDYSLMFRPA